MASCLPSIRLLGRVLILRQKETRIFLRVSADAYSHSMVPGGFEVMS
jgi:hypothetical protein